MIAVEKTVSQPELDPSNDLKSKRIQNGSVENNTVEPNGNILMSNGNLTKDANQYKHQNGSITQPQSMSTAGDKGPDRVLPSDELYTCLANGRVKLRESFEVNETPISVPTLLKQSAQKFSQLPAMAFKEDDQWNFITYSDYLKTVRTVAKAFLSLGLQRYHSVCILGCNSPEWFISDVAAIFAGGFAAGIYTTNSADACLHCIQTSNANIILVENDMQLQKILKIRDQAPSLKVVIQYTGKPSDSSVLSWDDLLEIGNKESEERLDSVIDSLAVNECCSLLYTSGTTSAPKAVMLSHDNIIFASKMAANYMGLQNRVERILSYLPLSHAAAQIADLYLSMLKGSCCYFADKNVLKGTMIQNLREVRPTIMFGVPRVWEKIRDGLFATEKNAPKLKQYLLSLARSTALQHYKSLSKGNVGESLMYKLLRRTIYAKVKEQLGLDKCRTFLVGAAPASAEVREYLSSFDMLIGEVFGMSETSGPHVVCIGTDVDFNCAGKTLPGMRTKIYNPDESGVGEVCMYGRNIFMGYLGDLEKTKEAIDEEGWLHSGDLGKCNKKSLVQITGRIKDLLITSGGENVAPSLIEMALKTELPVISHAVVIGDSRKYLSLLITLKTQINLDTGVPKDELCGETENWCKSLNCKCKTVSEIIREKPAPVFDAIQKGIDRVNSAAISQAQRIQKFTILPSDFSLPTGELGPTMKVMRRVVYSKYKTEIESMYA
jgi:long-chain-fatty-acid--CoA ligase ACSBG